MTFLNQAKSALLCNTFVYFQGNLGIAKSWFHMINIGLLCALFKEKKIELSYLLALGISKYILMLAPAFLM